MMLDPVSDGLLVRDPSVSRMSLKSSLMFRGCGLDGTVPFVSGSVSRSSFGLFCLTPSYRIVWVIFLFFKDFTYLFFREVGREGEGEGGKHQYVRDTWMG